MNECLSYYCSEYFFVEIRLDIVFPSNVASCNIERASIVRLKL